MADWFETRFREPVDPARIDPEFAARVRALAVKEWQADAAPAPPVDTDPDDHEGDIIMLETDDHPTGSQPPSPLRRSPGQWLLVAAAVALVAVVGAVLVANSDDGESKIDTVTPGPTPTSARPAAEPTDVMSLGPEFVELEPGVYVIDPDGDDSTPLRVTFDVASTGWDSWIGAVKFARGSHVAVSITTIDNLVKDGCLDHSPADPAVGPSVDDLATALGRLAPFAVTSPPSDVTILGYPGKHLQLTVPDIPAVGENFTTCADGEIHSWITKNNDGSFYGYNAEPGRTEDFWILDVDGTRLVLETTQGVDPSPQDIDEMQAIFDSIRIEP